MSETWERCTNCADFMIPALSIVQHEDAGHWNYCPNCGEPWSSVQMELKEAETDA